ncbi:hypothetical protein HJFPF1_12117 [Paramyrothecium foliicola]|nr:hypothetical protein HJFPF1_12117 [Paramyrothecium foliicola]
MPTLTDMPSEILRAILEYFEPPDLPIDVEFSGYYAFPPGDLLLSEGQRGSVSSLQAVCLTCVHLRAIAEPILYRNIGISKSSELKLLQTLLQKPELGLHIRALRADQVVWEGSILRTVVESLGAGRSPLLSSFEGALRSELTKRAGRSSFEGALRSRLTRRQASVRDDGTFVTPAMLLLAHAPNLHTVRVGFYDKVAPWHWILGGDGNGETAPTENGKQQVSEADAPRQEDNSGDTRSLSARSTSKRLGTIRRLDLRFQRSGCFERSDLKRIFALPGLEVLRLVNMDLNIGDPSIPMTEEHGLATSLTSLRLRLVSTLQPEGLEFLFRHMPNLRHLSMELNVYSMDKTCDMTGVARLARYGDVLRQHGHNLVFLDLCLLSHTIGPIRRTGIGSLRQLSGLQHLLMTREDLYEGEFESVFGVLGTDIVERRNPNFKDWLPRNLKSLCFHDKNIVHYYMPNPMASRLPRIISHLEGVTRDIEELKEDHQFPNLKSCGMNLREWKMAMQTC